MTSFLNKLKTKTIKAAHSLGLNIFLTPSIPMVCITGSTGKTTTCRMVSHILKKADYTVALQTSQGTYIGNETIRTGDSSRSKNALEIVQDKQSEVAVLELALGGLVHDGMLYSNYAVGAMLNVQNNHLGTKNNHSKEDLAKHKKSSVVHAKELAIINADDPLCLATRNEIKAKNLCFVSKDTQNPEVLKHQSQGGMVSFWSHTDQKIKLFSGTKLIGEVQASKIPATFGGLFWPPIENALFAIAIAHGLGIEFKMIESALTIFHSDPNDNPGRMNFYEHLPYKLLLTFASEKEAAIKLGDFLNKFEVDGEKHIFVSNTGENHDEYIKSITSSLSTAFHTYICTEKGGGKRAYGETSQLLAQGLIESGTEKEKIIVEPSFDNALRKAFSLAKKGDLLVINSFYNQDAIRLGLFPLPE